MPILVQIPVFIALFWTLLAAVELRYAPLALWITDMSVPDPYYVLPLLMGVSMWIQSKLSPKPADPMQAKIMQIMPVAFSIFFFFFPSGLVLYSLSNNILSIAQQWQITRMFEKKAAEEEERNKNKNKSKDKPKNDEDEDPLLLSSDEEETMSEKDDNDKDASFDDTTDEKPKVAKKTKAKEKDKPKETAKAKSKKKSSPTVKSETEPKAKAKKRTKKVNKK